MATRVVCVGNELVCDDGLGMRVGRVLTQLELPSQVEVVMAAEVGLDLIDVVAGAQRLVLVDATRSEHPAGTLRVLSNQSVADLAQTPCCCHAVGLPELLRLADKLDPASVPDEVVLVGVEAEVLDQFGTTLSLPVRRALPEAVGTVLHLVGASPELIARGRELAFAAADWEPSALEAWGG